MKHLALALLIPFFAATSAGAQSNFPLHKLDGVSAGDQFGARVAGLGDINNDGFDDVAVSSISGSAGFGYVKVYSGEDGSVLYTINSPLANIEFGAGLGGVGDLNNDGFRDFAIGAPKEANSVTPEAGSVRIYRGQTGLALYANPVRGTKPNMFFGTTILETGDFTGNGFADFVVAAPGEDVVGVDSGGLHNIFGLNGIDISASSPISAPSSTGYLVGTTMTSGGNITTATPFIDILAGAPGAPNGQIIIFRSDGSVFAVIGGSGPNEGFTASLSGVVDHNNDTRPDIVVGSPLNDANGVDAGRVQILVANSGAAVISTFLGSAPGDQFGASVANLGDVNGDGVPDLIVGSPGAGKAEVISGIDGVVLQWLSGSVGLGASVALAGDVDNNGVTDFIAGSPNGNNSGGFSSGIAIIDHADPGAEPNLELSDASEIMRIYQPGGLLPLPEIRDILNQGPTSLNWEATFPPAATWLTLDKTSGVIDGNDSDGITFNINPIGLTKAVYTTNVTFQNLADGADFVVVKVTLDVQDPLNTALICVSPDTSVNLNYVLGTPPPAAIPYTLTNCGNPTKTMNWQVVTATTSGGNWLQADMSSGSMLPTDPDPVVMVSLVPVAQLTPGLHTGTLTFLNDDEPTDSFVVNYTLSVELANFGVGAKLSGSIDFIGDLSGGSFISVDGMKFRFEMTVTTGNLKPVITVLDGIGNEVKQWKFKNAKKGQTIKKQLKLKGDGTFNVVIGGAKQSTGNFTLLTDRKLPGAAKPKTHSNATPPPPLSFVEVVVKALPGAIVNINATPKGATFASTFLSIYNPAGALVNTAPFSFVSSETLHLISLPLDDLGSYRIRVSGLDLPDASVTIQVAPFQPPKAEGDVSLD